MTGERFHYDLYIRGAQQKVWDGLRLPEFTRQYWYGVTLDCAWEKGASWRMLLPDGRVIDSGWILEIEPAKKVVIRWRHEFPDDLAAEGWSRCTLELEPQGEVVKLTVGHELENPVENSKFIAAVSGGWPQLLSSLKSLLETGAPLPGTSAPPKV